MRAAAALILAALAGAAQAQGRVLPDPTKPSPEGFKPHQLPFVTPKDGVAREQYRSLPFYAVILKSALPCAAAQKERAEIQQLFPANKVFAQLVDCGDDEDTIRYTNVKNDLGFIAVYGGDTPEQAQAVLAKAKETGRFPGVNLRRMQAVLLYP
jgi:hypothetical protein